MSKNIKRLGFHYFPDTSHFREQDLNTWLPELRTLGANWLTLIAPIERSIPEFFIKGLIVEGIQPVLHFPLTLNTSVESHELLPLFRTYADWGVRYIAIFDRPNTRAAWGAGSWAQDDLVERFLDRYLPFAEKAAEEGLIPVFPPMEPGGDYWDLAFLQNSLRGMARRNRSGLIEKMALGAYAWVNSRPLDWGLGGIDRWPGARPYNSPPGIQDHMGFRIFDWYEDICREELGDVLPIILLRAGALPGEIANDPGDGSLPHAQINLAIAQLLAGEKDGSQPIPQFLLACNFWILAADRKSKYFSQAWFQSNERRLPVVDIFRQWVGIKPQMDETNDGLQEDPNPNEGTAIVEQAAKSVAGVKEYEPEKDTVSTDFENQSVEHGLHPISHYVLLPLYAWGAGEWDLELIQPWIQESHPTVGFSLTEARLAKRVTVVGGPGAISDDVLRMLRKAGCQVERLLVDGTLIAT